MHRGEAYQQNGGTGIIPLRSTGATYPNAVQRDWDNWNKDIDATPETGRKERLRGKLSYVRSCLVLRSTAQWTTNRDISDYSSFDEYARQQSTGSATTKCSNDVSTVVDLGLDAEMTALPQLPDEMSDYQPIRRRSSAPLSKLRRRISNVARSGFVKLQTRSEERAVREQRRCEAMGASLRRPEDTGEYAYYSSRGHYDSYGYRSMDWRMSLAFMPG